MAVKPHAAALRDLRDQVEVVAAYSPTAARRAAFAADWPDFPLTDRLERDLRARFDPRGLFGNLA